MSDVDFTDGSYGKLDQLVRIQTATPAYIEYDSPGIQALNPFFRFGFLEMRNNWESLTPATVRADGRKIPNFEFSRKLFAVAQ